MGSGVLSAFNAAIDTDNISFKDSPRLNITKSQLLLVIVFKRGYYVGYNNCANNYSCFDPGT